MSGNWENAFCPVDGQAKARRVAGMGKIEEVFGAKLREVTTVGIGGPAERMVFPHAAREIQEILAAEREAGREVRALGAGSNLLVSDGGVRGTVICLMKTLGTFLFSGGGAVVSDGGTMLPRFAVLCALSGLSGAEELGGIPGTIGGALSMNAGAYGRSIGDIVEWVEIADGEGGIRRVPAREIGFGYRAAAMPVAGIVVRAGFRLRPASSDDVFALMKTLNEKRRAAQPWGERTFGSTFRNPPGGEKAAALLERAGLKGVRQGDAVYSEKHANFIVNRGRATATDVAALIARGRDAVRALAGIELVQEVKMWGAVDG